MISHEDIAGLVTEGEAISAKLELIKTEQSKENVEAYQMEIDRFLNKVTRVQHALSREIDERRGLKNTLKLTEDVLKTDKAEARSAMFRLIAELKETQYGRSPSNQ